MSSPELIVVENFIRMVKKNKKVWVLNTDEGSFPTITRTKGTGETCVPFWSSFDHASSSRKFYPECENVVEVSLSVLLEELMPNLNDKGYKMGIDLVVDGHGYDLDVTTVREFLIDPHDLILHNDEKGFTDLSDIDMSTTAPPDIIS